MLNLLVLGTSTCLTRALGPTPRGRNRQAYADMKGIFSTSLQLILQMNHTAFCVVGPMVEIVFERKFFGSSHKTGFYSIIRIRIQASRPTLYSLAGFGGLAECIPWGAGSQSALHVRINNSQAIHVASIDPSET